MFAAVPGSTIVETSATQSLITRGSRASRPVKVCASDIHTPCKRNTLAFFTLHVHSPIVASAPVPAKPSTGTACPKCGTIKKTKQSSCCAPDGAWANNCGGANSKLDHTWSQGIRACKGAASLLLGELQSQNILLNETTQTQSDSVPDGVSENEIASNGGCGKISKIISLICLLVLMTV